MLMLDLFGKGMRLMIFDIGGMAVVTFFSFYELEKLLCLRWTKKDFIVYFLVLTSDKQTCSLCGCVYKNREYFRSIGLPAGCSSRKLRGGHTFSIIIIFARAKILFPETTMKTTAPFFLLF
jgi:hypothetical protein